MRIKPDAVKVYARNLKVGMQIVGEGTIVDLYTYGRENTYVNITYTLPDGSKKSYGCPGSAFKEVLCG